MNVEPIDKTIGVQEETPISDITARTKGQDLEKEVDSSFDLKLTVGELEELLTVLKTNAPDLLFTVISQLENQFDTNDSISYPMSYSQFTLNQVNKQFNLKIADAELFDFVQLLVIPKEELINLETRLIDNKLVGGTSEKSRSEAIIFPILIELVKRNREEVLFFSGENFEVDKKQGLKGVFDYLLSGRGLSRLQISVPVIALVEAKKGLIDEHLGQCAAEMVAARLFNQKNKSNLTTIYGVVTTGKAWKFLKLEGDTIFIDKTDYYHSVHLQEIMTILQKIVDDYKITL